MAAVMRFHEIDGLQVWIPEGWDKFVFRGWVYRVVFGTVVRGECVTVAPLKDKRPE